MNELMLSVYLRIKEMPWLLKFIFAVCIGGILFSIFSVFPIAKYHINGKEVTYAELWSSGVGIKATLIGVISFITGLGIFKKKNWVKYTFLSVSIVSYISSPEKREMIYGVILFIIVFGGYLFLNKKAQDYFLSG